MYSIAIIDDEPDIRVLLSRFFTKKGYQVHTEPTGKAGIEWLKENEVDLVICDFKLPDYTGVDILQKIRIIRPETAVIIITGYSDVRIAVQALKKGAYDYVTKPLYPDELLSVVQQAIKNKSGKPLIPPKIKARRETEPVYILGSSPQSLSVQNHIKLIAPTEMSVVLIGETGTGKEYAAREIHRMSNRKDQPFVAVDCGALPKDTAGSELFGHVKGAFTGAIANKKGYFELADGGTIFLDEIGNLTYDNQVKLLRVLQERVVRPIGSQDVINVDVRLISATNVDLRELVRAGEFREDIYHRINEFKIELSPLRERIDDIPLFAAKFLSEASDQLNRRVEHFNDESLDILQKYYWHGNLRELRNVVKRAVLLATGNEVTKMQLPEEIISGHAPTFSDEKDNFYIGMPLKKVSEVAEKAAIIKTLEYTKGNKSKTAELLEVDRKTLYNKIRTYDIPLD
jgi:two-component system response regulator HydG